MTPTIEQIKEILAGAPDWDSCYSVKTGDYVIYPEHHNLSDLRTILAQHEEIERLREALETSQSKLLVMLDKHGEPDSWKCVVYDTECAETKLRQHLISRGWTPPKEQDHE